MRLVTGRVTVVLVLTATVCLAASVSATTSARAQTPAAVPRPALKWRGCLEDLQGEHPIWASETYGHPGVVLQLQDDGTSSRWPPTVRGCGSPTPGSSRRSHGTRTADSTPVAASRPR